MYPATVISIHAPREGGDQAAGHGCLGQAISIHAPREGGDCQGYLVEVCPFGISIHAPREGGDNITFFHIISYWYVFQSTPPARGATALMAALKERRNISIHAPREGGDSKDAQFYLRIFDK